MVKKRATKSVKTVKKAKVKSLPLAAKKAKGVRGGGLFISGDSGSTTEGREKWIEIRSF